MIYDFLSSTTTTKTYRITLILFRDENCAGNCSQMPASVRIGIYNNDDNSTYNIIDKTLDSIRGPLSIINAPTCITSAPNLVYNAGFYSIVVTLSNNSNGYAAAYQTCCRITNISNITVTNTNGEGATYTTNIPGNNQLGNISTVGDNSPRFSRNISVVCYNNAFSLDFSATDPNGDSLSYIMCSGFNGGSAQDASPIDPTPYGDLVYQSGFSGSTPLGINAFINPRTGIISGIAPAPGKYVVSVCVSSYRNGQYISTHRKDFIITVASCNFANATLNPNYVTCDGFSYSFTNLSSSPLNQTYYWNFGDPNSLSNNTSTLLSPTHVFSDTGVYRIKLVVNKNDPSCADSSEAIIRVFPGFVANFRYPTIMCKDVPVNFSDNTSASYGFPNKWFWNFGVNGTNADTSVIGAPTYTYRDTGTYNINMIVESNKGCKDTISKTIVIVDRPKLSLTRDTIICNVDSLHLNVSSSIPGGSFSWQPNYAINNTSIASPTVKPLVDTTYYVSFVVDPSYPACATFDSLKVRVVDTASLQVSHDTSICLTDSVQIFASGNGLQFLWSPAATLSNPNISNPFAKPTAALTIYKVTVSIGSCISSKTVTISTAPYPNAFAGTDTTICKGSSAFLSASGGVNFVWYPSRFLNNAEIANPVVINPVGNYVDYIVFVKDTLGCSKSTKDSVRVYIQNLSVDAGPSDTSMVNGQQLQLHATVFGTNDNIDYQWSPDNWGLSSLDIFNPVATPDDDIMYYVNVTSSIGCKSSDSIFVHYYEVLPDIYMPNAFTPNGDGLNDIAKPIPLGLISIEDFKIFNRWGKLVFAASKIGEGWDGKLNGSPQETGTFVWIASGTDYKNNKIQRKGSIILIR